MRMWAMQPIAGVRLTLVSNGALTPYSGMLPGLIAGHYNYRQSHIDVSRLCRWAGIRFISDEVIAVDPDQQTLQFKERPALQYDVLSIDTGSTPGFGKTVVNPDDVTPVKPIYQFYQQVQVIEKQIAEAECPLSLGVVGAGAGGFEVLLAMHEKFSTISSVPHKFHWIIRDQVLSSLPKSVGQQALAICNSRGIECHFDFDVARVDKQTLHSATGETIPLDHVIWCTQAKASLWPSQSQLQCDDKGFIAVNDFLQSRSHKNVFAAGDVAIQINHPRPKAGVFAVRQGPVLFKNIQRFVGNKEMVAYRPQRSFLTILSCGDQFAIASKGKFSISGKWVWQWKDWIDQRFMNRFNMLPAMEMRNDDSRTTMDKMRCGGCGAKVPADILHEVLSTLSIEKHGDQLVGIADRRDVAIMQPQNMLVAQSVDQVKEFIPDIWTFSRIATIHALSDLYAVGAAPQSALVNISLPFGANQVVKRDLEQIMDGVVLELNRAGAELSGGHTSEASETSIGMVVNGYLEQQPKIIESDSISVEHVLVLTKPIGVGVLLAADMRSQADGRDISAAIHQMLTSNKLASDLLLQAGASAMTDITGFGIIGHLSQILNGQNISATISISDIPLLPGALALSTQKIVSTLYESNVRAYGTMVEANGDSDILPLLYDPQTSGGLLAAVPKECGARCVENLKQNGYHHAAIIGEIVSPQKFKIIINPIE